MNHLDLFSGIGGFALAARWVWGESHNVVSFCEIDMYCQKVLRKHWPNAAIHDDIKTLDGTGFADVDILTGGFPCQPYSVAGQRRGAADDRALWPEMLRVISEARPRWIVGENVAGFIHMGLDAALSDLEAASYATEALVVPACAVDAPHRRDRVWIVAHAASDLRGASGYEVDDAFNRAGDSVADANGAGCDKQRGAITGEPEYSAVEQPCRWSVEPAMGRVAHGVPARVDRLKSLGNAIVPQVAAEIFRAIQRTDEEITTGTAEHNQTSFPAVKGRREV